MINKATSVNLGVVGAMRSLALPLFGDVITPVFRAPTKPAYIPEPTEPSLFTRGEGAVHPRWVRWFMVKFGLSHPMALNIGNALYAHLTNEPRQHIDLDSPLPPMSLPDEALVSMAFVLDYRHRYGVSFQVAYTMGYNVLFNTRWASNRSTFTESVLTDSEACDQLSPAEHVTASVRRCVENIEGNKGCTAIVIPIHK